MQEQLPKGAKGAKNQNNYKIFSPQRRRER